MTALSSADPGLPSDWRMESRWQAARKAPAVQPRGDREQRGRQRAAVAACRAPEAQPRRAPPARRLLAGVAWAMRLRRGGQRNAAWLSNQVRRFIRIGS